MIEITCWRHLEENVQGDRGRSGRCQRGSLTRFHSEGETIGVSEWLNLEHLSSQYLPQTLTFAMNPDQLDR